MEPGNKKIKVLVLKGGISAEREISLLSGANVEEALRQRGFAVEGFDVVSLTEEEIASLLKKTKPEVVFIALHGAGGEDGQIQKILMQQRVKFTGSLAKASFLAMDKKASRKAFSSLGIKVPPAFKEEEAEKIPASQFPLIVKPHFCGSSVGVSRVEKKEQLFPAISQAKKFSREVVIEKFIAGREISVGILGDMVLPVVEIMPRNSYYDYDCKYQDGLTKFIVPAPLDAPLYQKAQMIAQKSFSALGCRHFGRVDMMVGKDDGEIYVLELNSIPGLTSHSLLPLAAKAAGIDFPQLCEKIINLALRDEIN